MDRIYKPTLLFHLQNYSQMAFIVGPRQVGKTTLAKSLQGHFSQSTYLNWDNVSDRLNILSGQNFIEDIYPLTIRRQEKPLIIFDEIHKYRDWKNYLKGFFDTYKDYFHIVVTGSARLDIYQLNGDSLMGRYFQYRIHPFSVSELLNRGQPYETFAFNIPKEIAEEEFLSLYIYGGFPEVFYKRNSKFQTLWQETRFKQLIYEDIQSIEKLHEVSLLEVLATLLQYQAGQMLNRSNLASKIKVTTQTISRWIDALEKFYYCFLLKPWHKNVTRSLIKEPKVYLWDWSLVPDEGGKYENFIASHLLKFIQFWNDIGVYKLELYYLRDQDKKEVDFLVVRNHQPWFSIEAKTSITNYLQSLSHFEKQLKTEYNLQVVKMMPFDNQPCFDRKGFWQVPAKTFLSQLV